LKKKKGILKYKEIYMAEFNMVTGKINNATNGSRKAVSVASMLRRTKGPVFELIKRAEDIKKRLNNGERLLKKELFPKDAITMDRVAVEKEEEEEECDAATTDNHLMREVMVRFRQDTPKRKRGDEQVKGFEEVLEGGLGKKRPRTKEEEDTVQAMTKTLYQALPDESDGDDGFEAGLDM
jgi:hypothetical protein